MLALALHDLQFRIDDLQIALQLELLLGERSFSRVLGGLMLRIDRHLLLLELEILLRLLNCTLLLNLLDLNMRIRRLVGCRLGLLLSKLLSLWGIRIGEILLRILDFHRPQAE